MPELPTGTLTLLFTDIEGSTHLLEQLGERYASVLADCRHLLRSAFLDHHGYEVDTQGDAFFVVFARASDAVAAAVAVQRALFASSWPQGVAVRVRIGIHTGEPTLTSDGYVGLDVHHAARIMSAAHGGQILLSPITCQLVEQHLPEGTYVQDLGQHRLKDLQRPDHLFQVNLEGLPADFPPLKTLDTSANNLPILATPFIGREQEVATLSGLLRRPEVRLVTLSGPGGVGKTRLALHVAAELADQFADGVFLVPLAHISDPEQVVPALLRTLSIREVGGQSHLELLISVLKDKEMLLLLDNFEQVTTAAVQLAKVLAACPNITMLVTSREVLHLQAEHECGVPPLTLPDLERLPDLVALSQYEAVALFIERAHAVKPDFAVTNTNAPAVAAICACLDGLPLAIELAAARVKFFAPQALLTRLEQGLSVLSGGARDLPARQQTLRDAIAWSYDLLSPGEQQLFRRLSVFVDGCTLDAAEEVCTAAGPLEGDLLDGLMSLVDKSLLRQAEGAQGTTEEDEPRFWMLQTLREFGLEVLAASGEEKTVRQAHAAYYMALAEKAEPCLRSAQQPVWLARLEAEHGNLLAAMRWLIGHGEKEKALRMGGVLWHFWEMSGRWSEGRNFLEQALAASEGVAPAIRAKALNGAGVLIGHQGDSEKAMALCQESLALSRKLGDTLNIALSLYWLGQIGWSAGNMQAPDALLEEALRLFKELDDTWGMRCSLEAQASVAVDRGEYDRARSLLEESLALSRKSEDKWGIANSLQVRAWMLLWSDGDYMSAHHMLEESLALARDVGDKELEANGELLLGMVAFFQGEYSQARSLLEESVVLSRKMGSEQGIATGLLILAATTFAQGDAVKAYSLYEESLALWRKMENQKGIAYVLENLAVVVVAQGQLRWAVQLWGAVEALREAYGVPKSPPVLWRLYEQAMETARAQLGEEAFAAAWAQGRTKPLDEVIEGVLKIDIKEKERS